MAHNSLRRRGQHLVFAMIALFIGIVAMGLGVVVIQNAQTEMDERTVPMTGYNVQVIGPAVWEGQAQEDLLKQAVNSLPVDEYSSAYHSLVQEIRPIPAVNARPMQPVLIGLEEPGAYRIDGAAMGQQPGGCLRLSLR